MTEEQLFAEEKVCNGKCQDDIDKNYVHCKDCVKIKYFLAGLHEGQPKWHDLRKDPNDLPKEDVVLVQTKSNCHFIALYYPDEKWWGTYELLSQRIRGEIIAWCEIPQFNSEE